MKKTIIIITCMYSSIALSSAPGSTSHPSGNPLVARQQRKHTGNHKNTPYQQQPLAPTSFMRVHSSVNTHTQTQQSHITYRNSDVGAYRVKIDTNTENNNTNETAQLVHKATGDSVTLIIKSRGNRAQNPQEVQHMLATLASVRASYLSQQLMQQPPAVTPGGPVHAQAMQPHPYPYISAPSSFSHQASNYVFPPASSKSERTVTCSAEGETGS